MHTSIKTGLYTDPTAWDQGTVPNPTIHDVTIAVGHVITVTPAAMLSFFSHQLNINGTLVLQAGVTVAYVYGVTPMSIGVNGELSVEAGAVFVTTGACVADGDFDVSGTLSIVGDLTINHLMSVEENGTLQLHIGGNASLTMGPDSLLSFHRNSTVQWRETTFVRPIPAPDDVWNTAPPYCGLTPTKRASSITNLTPANVKGGVVIDDVTGHYTAADIPNCTPVNIRYGVTIGDVVGTLVPYAASLTAYISRSDLDIRFGSDNVTKWADKNENGDSVEILSAVNWAIDQACTEFDDTMRDGRLQVPLALPAPKTVIDIVAGLAACILYESRGVTDFDSETGRAVHRLMYVRKRAEERMRLLRAGKLRLDIATTATREFAVSNDDSDDFHMDTDAQTDDPDNPREG